MIRLLFTLGLMSIMLASSYAQSVQLPLTSPLSWPGTTGYDSSIPTPDEVLGYRIGERHTIPSNVVRYFEAVAEASDRVTLETHGHSYEGRPLIYATVTAPSNHTNIDAIQRQHQDLFTSPESISDEDLNAMPAVAYMGYSVHGDEASGTEAAILTLYHLAAGQGAEVEKILENVVTLIDPMFNPDGRDRFTDWANRNRGAVATSDPQDREHNQAWPGGRTNHYWFDLNRDWLPLQHPESRARIALFNKWQPQVLTDYHEMGSEATYFFQPGIPSRTNPFTPPENQSLTGELTNYSAAALDEIGSLYYTRESFDDFYYGKGSTYPDINGAMGILFEQASSRALEREISGGKIDYGFSVRNQTSASLGILKATAEIRKKLLTYTRNFYRDSGKYSSTYGKAGYLIPLPKQRSRALELAEILRQHRVRVYLNTATVTSRNGTHYAAGDALVIPTDQRQSRFMKAVLEPNLEFADSLFYDVTTWTLPMAFDVEMESLNRLPGDTTKMTRLVADMPSIQGTIVGSHTGQTPYAYVMPLQGHSAARALYDILSKGGQARLMHEPFQMLVDGKPQQIERGSIVIPVRQSPIGADSLQSLIQSITKLHPFPIYAATSGLTPTGPDFGARSSTLLKEPKVAILVGPGTSPYQAGEAWHLLSERLAMPVSLLDVDRLSRVNLDRYTHIVMTGGRYNDVDTDDLSEWIRSGGTLLASHNAANWAVRKGLVKLNENKLDVDSLIRDLPYAQLDEARGAQVIGGAILEVELDDTHPLSYGIGSSIPMFRKQTAFYEPSDIPGATVGKYSDKPLISGYLSGERNKQAAGKAAIISQDMGRGRAILFFDIPMFRAFWRGSERVWLNGVLLAW